MGGRGKGKRDGEEKETRGDRREWKREEEAIEDGGYGKEAKGEEIGGRGEDEGGWEGMKGEREREER